MTIYVKVCTSSCCKWFHICLLVKKKNHSSGAYSRFNQSMQNPEKKIHFFSPKYKNFLLFKLFLPQGLCNSLCPVARIMLKPLASYALSDLKDGWSRTEQIRSVPVVLSLFINGNNSVLIFRIVLYQLCDRQSSSNDFFGFFLSSPAEAKLQVALIP